MTATSAPPATPATPVGSLRTRIVAAQDAAFAAGVDALLVPPGPDLRYLTGAANSSHERLTCLVVPATASAGASAASAGAAATLVVPRLEQPGWTDTPLADLGIEAASWTDAQDPYRLVAALLGSPPRRVALGDAMTAAHVLRLRAVLPGAEQVLAGPVLGPLRMRKDAAEVDALARAGAAIDRVHARMGDWLRPGRTENEAAADITAAMLEEGHTEAAFVIVGSGPNGASPHHEASARRIEPGDVVVVDIGGPTPEGYFSDCTRTYAIGEPAHSDVADVYPVLQRAQDAAVAAVRPGATAGQVDAAARDQIAAAGLADSFFHRTGHGIGLEVHEEPYIGGDSQLTLAPGMAFSVEPGSYHEGRWGARIEDIVVVDEHGARRINHQPRELTVL